eukprot:Sdes_comp23685_c0_seq1m21862
MLEMKNESRSTEVNPTQITTADKKVKKPRVLASISCTACKAAHRACRGGRPCMRCLKYGIGDQCRDSVQKKRGPVLRKIEMGGLPSQKFIAPASHLAPQLFNAFRMPLEAPHSAPLPSCEISPSGYISAPHSSFSYGDSFDGKLFFQFPPQFPDNFCDPDPLQFHAPTQLDDIFHETFEKQCNATSPLSRDQVNFCFNGQSNAESNGCDQRLISFPEHVSVSQIGECEDIYNLEGISASRPYQYSSHCQQQLIQESNNTNTNSYVGLAGIESLF